MSMTRLSSSGCSWLPSRSWPAFAQYSPTKATTPSLIASYAAPFVPSQAFTSVVSRAGRDWASGAGRSNAATPGYWRTDASPCAMTGSASLSSPCFKPPAYSRLQAASPANSENRLLVVHPLNEADIWKDSDRKAAWLIISYLQPKESHSICRMHHLAQLLNPGARSAFSLSPHPAGPQQDLRQSRSGLIKPAVRIIGVGTISCRVGGSRVVIRRRD